MLLMGKSSISCGSLNECHLDGLYNSSAFDLFIIYWAVEAFGITPTKLHYSAKSSLHCQRLQHYAMNGLPCADKGSLLILCLVNVQYFLW